MADLYESMSRVLVSCKKNSTSSSSTCFTAPEFFDDSAIAAAVASSSSAYAPASSSSRVAEKIGGVSEGVINQVDQFLREALLESS